MDNMDIYNILKSVPDVAKKTITGGRLKGMTDIKPMWRIEKLTETFGMCGIGWKAPIIKKEIIDGANGEKVAIVDINLYVKVNGEWSDAIQGTGGSSFIANEKSGLYTSDECFKMAYTDALSVACKSLGMGADVYWGDSKYPTQPNQATPQPTEINLDAKLGFGTKHKDHTWIQVFFTDIEYFNWLLENTNDAERLATYKRIYKTIDENQEEIKKAKGMI